MLIDAITILIIMFIIFNLIFFYSLSRQFRIKGSKDGKINFSIVVSARNESENIPGLIHSLENLNYPSALVEKIFIDDNSKDNTYKNILEAIKNKSQNFVYKAENKIMPAKKGALSIGIEKAASPNIMITDADCVPGREWLNAFAAKFNEKNDIVFGIAPFYQENNIINRISCFENLRTSFLIFGLAGIGLPYAAFARSLGFSKKAFEKVNGYSNTLETLSGDDDLFIREAVKNNLKIGTVTDKSAFVYSFVKKSLKDYFRQKARHITTSNYYLLRHQVILGLWHMLNLIFLFSPALIFFNQLYGFLFVMKLVNDLLLVSIFQNKFGYRFTFFQRIYLQFFYELFLVLHYLRGTFGKRRW